MDQWNELVAVINNKSLSDEIRNYAKMLLGQFNTASGSRIKPDIERFILDKDKQSYHEAYKAFKANGYKVTKS